MKTSTESYHHEHMRLVPSHFNLLERTIPIYSAKMIMLKKALFVESFCLYYSVVFNFLSVSARCRAVASLDIVLVV